MLRKPNHSLTLQSITKQQFFKPKPSTGAYNISNTLIKSANEEVVAQPLTINFKQMFYTGILLDLLKLQGHSFVPK